MKIKVIEKSYQNVLAMPQEKHQKPTHQMAALRGILKAACWFLLQSSQFSYEKIGMEKLGKKEPCLVLMNHSSFIDLEIAAYLMADREWHIVTTLDGFVGKAWLMRLLGCISTKKFINDVTLVRDMHYTVKDLNASVIMYPEASYSFDGTATPLPESLGKCLKLLKVPVVMIRTEGAFLHDPLYNCLQVRKTKVSATMKYLLSPEEIKEKSVDELNQILAKEFDFDNFKEQQEKGIIIDEKFRADGLHRVLYKCPHCGAEGKMHGEGTTITCHDCGNTYELTEEGYLKSLTGETLYSHVPDWYRWERECVKKELEERTYRLDIPVDIYMLVNTECVYKVGEGRLLHTAEGFRLTGCEGPIDYCLNPQASYSLYSDFFWYEIGDMISIGDEKIQYYCFPKNGENVAAKTRLATEELYKLTKCTKLKTS